mgnify:CR=1 FL=1
MSNNTARLAREWAEGAKDFPNAEYSVETKAAIEHILATTDPLTMADTEWDTKKHRLAGATTSDGDEVVMLWHDDIDTDHIITDHAEWQRDRLTPNGKHYELREVGATEEPAHPETLVTVGDYENAPEGTIVARGDHAPLLKRGPNAWTTEYNSLAYDEDMAGTERQVLRKGWGK